MYENIYEIVEIDRKLKYLYRIRCLTESSPSKLRHNDF